MNESRRNQLVGDTARVKLPSAAGEVSPRLPFAFARQFRNLKVLLESANQPFRSFSRLNQHRR
jgi:hypothetical protein